MSVYPVTWELPEAHGRYKHFARRDAEIWERYLAQYGHEIEAVAYDVALGGQIPDDPEASEGVLLGWQYTTAAKVDVVAERAEQTLVIEVKPNASFSALGQVLSYLLLLDREPLTDGDVLPVIITDNASPDMLYVANQLNVEVIVV